MKIWIAGDDSRVTAVGKGVNQRIVVCCVLGCGEAHEAGKCQMEEFCNLIRQKYSPTKHAGMLPEKAEKMRN
uniref:Uncharacterized protein n=1 Tax=Peronospora matthiolae TaxID=2874970 RepID=A0AAV1TX91_9STRA